MSAIRPAPTRSWRSNCRRSRTGIVRLEATRGDGRFDRSVVFADKMMFPEGRDVVRGPRSTWQHRQGIWKLTDTNGGRRRRPARGVVQGENANGLRQTICTDRISAPDGLDLLVQGCVCQADL